MMSYAVDAKVTVDRSNDEQHAIVKATVAQGVMRLTQLTRQITTYRVKTADPGEHHLLIEHPRLGGWSLNTPDPTHVDQRQCLSHSGDSPGRYTRHPRRD